MPRPIRPWFRFYVETFPDRKIRRLPPAQRWVWAAVLGAARESPEPGRLLIAEGLGMTIEELADYADVKVKEAQSAVDAMLAMSMLTEDDDAVLRVRNWDHRQFESDNVSERTRAHRERSQEQGTNVPKNVRRNVPETETETETEQMSKERSSEPRKRGSRLPDDWKPTEADLAWQRERGISDLLARRSFEKFGLYWRAKAGKDATKLDWSATWRNWLLTEQDRQPRAVNGGTPSRPAGWEFGMDI